MDLTDLQPDMLVQTPVNDLLKVVTVTEDRVTAQVVYPIPDGTIVHEYVPGEVEPWRQASAKMVRKYEAATAAQQQPEA